MRLVGPHARHGLVEQQETWTSGQSHGDLELTLLAVGQGARQHVRARAQPHHLEKLAGGGA